MSISLSMCGWKPRRRRHGILQASAIFARRSRPCGRPAQPGGQPLLTAWTSTREAGEVQKATHVGTASKSYTQRMRQTELFMTVTTGEARVPPQCTTQLRTVRRRGSRRPAASGCGSECVRLRVPTCGERCVCVSPLCAVGLRSQVLSQVGSRYM